MHSGGAYDECRGSAEEHARAEKSIPDTLGHPPRGARVRADARAGDGSVR